MTTITCDRCGKILNSDPTKEPEGLSCVIGNGNYLAHEKSYDFCEDCIEVFKRTMLNTKEA